MLSEENTRTRYRTCSLFSLKCLTRHKVVISAALLTFSTASSGVWVHTRTRTHTQRKVSGDGCSVNDCARLLGYALTRYGSGKAIWLVVQQSLSELRLSTARRTNQCNRPLPIGRLVIQSHFLIGEYLLIVHIFANGKKPNNNDYCCERIKDSKQKAV